MNQQYRNVLKIKCFGSFSSWHSFLFVSKIFIQIIVFGYITVDTYITFGDSRPDLDHAVFSMLHEVFGQVFLIGSATNKYMDH